MILKVQKAACVIGYYQQVALRFSTEAACYAAGRDFMRWLSNHWRL